MKTETETLHAAIKICLTEINSRMTHAARIAKASEACANAGSVEEAVTISMDLEQLFYEAGRLQDAAMMLKRVAND